MNYKPIKNKKKERAVNYKFNTTLKLKCITADLYSSNNHLYLLKIKRITTCIIIWGRKKKVKKKKKLKKKEKERKCISNTNFTIHQK